MSASGKARWPKGGKAARDSALMSATAAQRVLFSILTDDCTRQQEYQRISRAVEQITQVIRELQTVEPDRE